MHRLAFRAFVAARRMRLYVFFFFRHGESFDTADTSMIDNWQRMLFGFHLLRGARREFSSSYWRA